MFSANTYIIRTASADDADALRRLAERSGLAPLTGAILIGEIKGRPAAAVGVSDGRVVASPTVDSNVLVAQLRVRAGAARALAAHPVLRERLLARLSVGVRDSSTPVAQTGPAELRAAA
jgi:hypothetical protein